MNKKSIILAGAIGLSLVNMASAVNYVYFTGSTAARNSVVAAMTTVGVVFDSITSQVGQGNATFAKCTYHIITGHLVGDPVGVVTSIKTDWSGSEGGIADLVGGNENFLDDTAVSSSSPRPDRSFHRRLISPWQTITKYSRRIPAPTSPAPLSALSRSNG